MSGRLDPIQSSKLHQLGGCSYSNWRPKSVRNYCVIDIFIGVVLSHVICFCLRDESDTFVFLFKSFFTRLWPITVGNNCHTLKTFTVENRFYCAIDSYIVPCEKVFSFCHVFHNVIIWLGCHFAVLPIDIGQTAKWHQFHITTILNTWQNENTISHGTI